MAKLRYVVVHIVNLSAHKRQMQAHQLAREMPSNVPMAASLDVAVRIVNLSAHPLHPIKRLQPTL